MKYIAFISFYLRKLNIGFRLQYVENESIDRRSFNYWIYLYDIASSVVLCSCCCSCCGSFRPPLQRHFGWGSYFDFYCFKTVSYKLYCIIQQFPCYQLIWCSDGDLFSLTTYFIFLPYRRLFRPFFYYDRLEIFLGNVDSAEILQRFWGEKIVKRSSQSCSLRWMASCMLRNSVWPFLQS